MSTPPHEQLIITSQHILQTPPITQPSVQTTPGSSGLKDFSLILENIRLENIGDFNFVTNDVVKKLQKKVEEVIVENKRLVDHEKKLEGRVKTVESENSSLLKKVEADQAEIDILKVRIAELEEEKAQRDEQNEYFRLKNKELEAINAKKEHEMYMMNKVLENLIGKSVEQNFEEIELEEVRARRKAEIDAEMKNKGKGVLVEGVSKVTKRAIVLLIVPESPIQNPCPISVVSGIFDEDVEVDDVVNDDDEEEDGDEEEDNEIKKDDADDVFSTNSDHDDDDNDDDDHGSTGIKVTEASTEENVDDYLHDDANEEPENVEGEGEHDDSKNVDDSEKLILHLKPNIEEGEIRHTYTLDEIIKMTHDEDIDFKFDFEEELNNFDINQQPDYQYKYVEEADNYDRVEVEDWSDEDQSESVHVDTTNFPRLAEFFSQANHDELRRKVEERVKNKSFDEMSKDERREERKKWFRKSSERKFKLNAYAIRREFGVQYFAYIQDIMSLPWWDVEELPKVRTLSYPVRERDMPTWGLMKFEAFKDFKHWKPHQPKKVK
ncbi:putative transcription factor bZIP family [Helianthus anomalus]